MILKENLEAGLKPVVEQSPVETGKKVEKQTAESLPRPIEKVSQVVTPQVPVQSVPVAQAAPVVKDPLVVSIEKVLEDGLGDAYVKLPLDKKQEFKTVGEQTAQKIAVLFQQTKVKLNEVFNLIVDWLKIIPGVNKFFLEQEAKIKTDRLIKMNNKLPK